MAADQCDATLRYADETLHCDLPADHTKPTGVQPQGSPHRSGEHEDVLTGDPTTWWG
jgi:hypothetical protein